MKTKTTLLLSIVLFSFSSFAQINLTNGLIAYFPFTGNAGDSSGLSNHGVPTNGASLTSDRFNTPNSAYAFDGVDDYINIPTYTNMSPTNAVSIAAWVKGTTTGKNAYVFDRLEINDGYGLMFTSTGNLRLSINGGQVWVTSTQVVADNQWHHVAGTYDRNKGVANIYVDGVIAGTGTLSSSITYTPEPRNGIGGTGQIGTNSFFNGSIDEVRIYNRAINLCEIEKLADVQYNLSAGLIGHFMFSGNSSDSSGLGNHGVPTNGASLTTDRFNTPNSAYYFDGVDDYINIPTYNNMSPTNAVSMAAWVKADSVNNLRYIYDRIEINDGYGLTVTANGNLRITINGGQGAAVSSQKITDGQWHHVVGTYDKNTSQLKVYIDCVEDGSSTLSSSITYSPEPRNGIGGPGQPGYMYYFKGSIDDLRIYNRALTACEINQLCNTSIITSINEQVVPSNELTIYPNPANNYVSIDFSSFTEKPSYITIIDSKGAIVSEININKENKVQLNTSALTNGIYFINVVGNSYSNAGRFVIAR